MLKQKKVIVSTIGTIIEDHSSVKMFIKSQSNDIVYLTIDRDPLDFSSSTPYHWGQLGIPKNNLRKWTIFYTDIFV